MAEKTDKEQGCTTSRQSLPARASLILLIFGVLLLLAGLIIKPLSFLMQFAACACFGAVVLLLCYIRWENPRIQACCRVLRRLILAGILVFLLSLVWIESLILAADEGTFDPAGEYLLVLGAAVDGSIPSATLASRIDTAADYLNAHPNSKAVLSGGKGRGEDISEAEAMFISLTARGIAPERLLLEGESTSTAENFAFSRPYLEQLAGGPVERLAVVSNGYHLYRAALIAREQGISDIEAIAAPTPEFPLLALNCYLREYFALIKFYLIR